MQFFFSNHFLIFISAQSFLSDIQLNDHIQSTHYITSTSADSCVVHLKFECTKCDEAFESSELLREHNEKHHHYSTELHQSKYICKICGNLFGGHAQLSAHKRLHKERPFKCDQCEKAYPRKVELDIHMRSHTGELPYACHLCEKRFAIKVRLTYHLQKHEGVKHSCPYCTAVYDNRNKLKAHLFKHTGMPYKCDLCPGLGFERRLR